MLDERVAVEEELLAEVTPWVRQDFSTAVRCGVSLFNVAPQVLHVVDPLLPDEHGSAFKANETESLLMRVFHVASQTLLIWEVLLRGTLVHKASQSAKLHALNLGGSVRVVDVFIMLVDITSVAFVIIKVSPREAFVGSNDDFIQLLLAKSARFVIHQ